MQFKVGTSVYSFDDQIVGRVDCVVLNPRTKEVTDIGVRKGFLLTEDKIVPLSLIASATEDRVLLREDAGNLDKLPPFEETYYISSDDMVDSVLALYWYPTKGSGGDEQAPYRIEMEQNIPEETVALEEGARVFSANNHPIGNVTRVITESACDGVAPFVLSEGLLFKEKRLIPVTWISEIQDGEIHLSVGTSVLDKLPEYQEA